MSDYKASQSLIDALRHAAGRSMTHEEVREQQISFVLSAVDEGSDVTRAEVEAMLDRREGKAA